MNDSDAACGVPAALAFGHSLAQRAIDAQERLLASEHQKADQLARLGVAILAGKVAIVGMLVNLEANIGVARFLGLAFGVTVVCVGVFQLFWVSVTYGRESRFQGVADIDELDALLSDGRVAADVVASSSLQAMASDQVANTELIQHMVGTRALAGAALGVGVVAHLISLAFIVGDFIHA